MIDASPELLVLVIAIADAQWGRYALISQQNEWQSVRAPEGPKHLSLLQWFHKFSYDGTGLQFRWIDDNVLCLIERYYSVGSAVDRAGINGRLCRAIYSPAHDFSLQTHHHDKPR